MKVAQTAEVIIVVEIKNRKCRKSPTNFGLSIRFDKRHDFELVASSTN
jgi:hypothetical protein